jgi:hypothetical protein
MTLVSSLSIVPCLNYSTTILFFILSKRNILTQSRAADTLLALFSLNIIRGTVSKVRYIVSELFLYIENLINFVLNLFQAGERNSSAPQTAIANQTPRLY